MVTEEKRLGQTYTPEEIVDFINQWAIRDTEDEVLDPAVGEGAFVFNAFERLNELGSNEDKSFQQIYGRQIHGVDVDKEAVERLQSRAEKELGSNFPNVDAGSIFEEDLSDMDAVVGNPPYVKRHLFEDPEKIEDQYAGINISGQADMYIYFVLKCLESLKTDGRFAMILSNSWMKKKYGKEFKKFLLKYLEIDTLIGFKEKAFPEREVNSVIILGRKKEKELYKPGENEINFIQIEDTSVLETIDIEDISSTDDWSRFENEFLHFERISQSELKPGDYWDIWLRAPKIFRKLKESNDFSQLEDFADVSIGVQTLHKDFYVLSKDRAKAEDIEDRFLRPFAYSPKDHQNPVLRKEDADYLVFWCSEKIEDINGTKAFEYIIEAENSEVEKRYSEETYDGVHNKTRIKKANRSPWYNLTEEAERRLPSQVLLPRRVYDNYTAVWNKDQIVPNENFLATTVKDEDYLKPLLAYLNSSLGELCLRLSGHVYGGGVCDLNVSSARQIQCLDLDKLNQEELQKLEDSFEDFKEDGDENVLDEAVYDVLKLDSEEREEINDALDVAIEESIGK